MASQDQSQAHAASAGDVKHRSVSPSPHAQQYHDPTMGLPVDPSMSATFAQQPSFGNINQDPDFGPSDAYGYSGTYLSAAPQTQSVAPTSNQSYPPALNADNLTMSQTFDPNLVNQLDPLSGGLQSQSADENYANLLNSNTGDLDFSAFQNHNLNGATSSEYNASLLLDPQMQAHSMHQGVNPADLVSPMSNPSVSSHPSSQDQQQSSPGPVSPHGSASGTYYTPQHSRNTSLDPSSAAYLTAQSNPDWQSVMNNSAAFQGHRRAPSEVSEVSSANHSPYLSQHEYDGIENNTSPSLAAQNDPTLYENAQGIESFTLSEQQQQQPGFSPLHSPYISPQLMPQQGNEIVPNAQYLPANMTTQFPSAPADMYGIPTDEMMNAAMNSGAADIGQASQMAPPSINVEFAPPSRNSSFGPNKPAEDFDSLSPPAMSAFVCMFSYSFQTLIYRHRSPNAQQI